MLNTRGVEAPGNLPDIVQSLCVVRFRAESESLKKLFLPEPMKPVGDGDIGYVIMVDSAFPALREGFEEAPQPDLTEFTEVAIGIPGEYDGKKYLVLPLLYLDRPTAAIRRGFTRGVAHVHNTKFHPLLEGRREIEEGSIITCNASRPTGEMLARTSLKVERKITQDELPWDEGMMNWLHIRYLPDLTSNGKKPLAEDFGVFHMNEGDPQLTNIWAGEGSVTFGGDGYDRLQELDINITEKLESYFFVMAYGYASDSKLTTLNDGGERIWRKW